MDFNIIKTIFSDIANAIRSKKGTDEDFLPTEFAGEIIRLETGSGDSNGGITDPYPTSTIMDIRGSFYQLSYNGCNNENTQRLIDGINWNNENALSYLCYMNKTITKIPEISDGTNITALDRAFHSATELTDINENMIYFTKLTAMNQFGNSTALSDVPRFDLSGCRAVDCSYFLQNNKNITRASDHGDWSACTSAVYFFAGCTALEVNEISTFRPTTCTSMFSGCTSLTDFGDIDCSRSSAHGGMFTGCVNLTRGRLINPIRLFDISPGHFGFEEDGTPVAERGLDQLVEDLVFSSAVRAITVNQTQYDYLDSKGLVDVARALNWSFTVA